MENGDLKIYGAGLLSSAGELRHVIQGIRAGQVCIQKFNVEDAYNTECVVTDFQKRYFYTESIEQAKGVKIKQGVVRRSSFCNCY